MSKQKKYFKQIIDVKVTLLISLEWVLNWKKLVGLA
jgi:hypothetical protein